ncbi:DUF4351 domain-containing protein [Cylindrospermopsis raciborskii]|uniref:DUF4351 domain-containing protein n=1 Tax=Cylindrospermopsis raciborskii TaxID=77022 RepID=UPI0030FE3A42
MRSHFSVGIRDRFVKKAIAMVIRQLTRRLGELSEQRLGQIRQLSVPQLEALAESLLDFRDISDLEAWLKDAEKSNDLKPQVDIQNGNQLDV